MAVEISEEDDSQPGGYHLKRILRPGGSKNASLTPPQQVILRGSAQIVRRL
jgi:hypothetical protein